MKLEDYETWRAVPSDRSPLLLDWDTGKPTQKTLASADGPLARVGAALHADAKYLTSEDCEHVIGWLKRIKRSGSPSRPTRDFAAFEQMLKELRDSTEQVSLIQRAGRYGIASSAWAIGAIVIAALAIVCALVTSIRWYWAVAVFIVALIVFVKGQQRALAAALTWKEQDRRYLMHSLAAARTVSELSWAGIFAYLPGAEFGPGHDEKRARTALLRERVRLTDALYNDPDGWLDEPCEG